MRSFSSGVAALQIVTPTGLTLEGGASGKLPLRLRLAADAADSMRGRSSTIGIEVTATGDGAASKTMTEKSTFFVPR